MFDGKMSGILTGAGGAKCQLCTATFDQLHDLEFRGVSRIVRREVFRVGAVPRIICNEVERPVDCTFDSPELKVEGGD